MSETDAPQIHHMALLVVDLEAAERFYVDVIKLPLQRRWTHEDGTLRSVWLEVGGSLLMLELASARGVTVPEGDGGWRLLALTIPASRREWWRNHLHEAGVALTGESPHSLYFNDPEGNRLALSHWPSPST